MQVVCLKGLRSLKKLNTDIVNHRMVDEEHIQWTRKYTVGITKTNTMTHTHNRHYNIKSISIV